MTGHLGPYTQAVPATSAGVYRLSKWQIRQSAGDLFELSISTGMISQPGRQSAGALEPRYNELVALHEADVIGPDQTSWGQERGKAWRWVVVTALFTVFTIASNPSTRVVQAVLVTRNGPIAVTDRCNAYDKIAADGRRVCCSAGGIGSRPMRWIGGGSARRWLG